MAECMDLLARSGTSERTVDYRAKEKMAFFIDHLSAYITGSENEVSKTVLQHSDFTENIGKAVQLYMSQLSKTYHSDEFWLLVFLNDGVIVGRFVTNLSTYLARFVPHHCYFFLAVVCELLVLSRAFEDWYIDEAVREEAVNGMAMFLPWCEDKIYEQLDASARELLARENINLRLEEL